MEDIKNLVNFSDEQVIELYKSLEKRIVNMEKLSDAETLMWNEVLAELLRRDILG